MNVVLANGGDFFSHLCNSFPTIWGICGYSLVDFIRKSPNPLCITFVSRTTYGFHYQNLQQKSHVFDQMIIFVDQAAGL
jgi:hypothetical protein